MVNCEIDVNALAFTSRPSFETIFDWFKVVPTVFHQRIYRKHEEHVFWSYKKIINFVENKKNRCNFKDANARYHLDCNDAIR